MLSLVPTLYPPYREDTAAQRSHQVPNGWPTCILLGYKEGYVHPGIQVPASNLPMVLHSSSVPSCFVHLWHHRHLPHNS